MEPLLLIVFTIVRLAFRVGSYLPVCRGEAALPKVDRHKHLCHQRQRSVVRSHNSVLAYHVVCPEVLQRDAPVGIFLLTGTFCQ